MTKIHNQTLLQFKKVKQSYSNGEGRAGGSGLAGLTGTGGPMRDIEATTGASVLRCSF